MRTAFGYAAQTTSWPSAGISFTNFSKVDS